MALDILEISLGARTVGRITSLGGDRTIFSFDEAYVDDPDRPTLSLSFKDTAGALIRDQRPTQTRLSAFFSNLLPEGPLRTYLAERAGVKPEREFFLLRALARDLPGAVVVRSAETDEAPSENREAAEGDARQTNAAPLRFSLAGVQLKFSAVAQARGGLTIPATGVGGDWIVKLPSAPFAGVSENEFSMMTLARAVGIDVPEIQLLGPTQVAGLPEGVGRIDGAAFAIKRFDRSPGGGRIHTEDFAQVLGVYPEKKYEKASYRLVAKILWLETGEAGVTEFIRRLVFNALIGNADMHLKNWSLLYRDGVTPELAPAYDFVSTIAYIPDDKAALSFGRTQRWDRFNEDELAYMAAKAGLPERLVLATAARAVATFREVWSKERAHLPVHTDVVAAVQRQLEIVPLANR